MILAISNLRVEAAAKKSNFRVEAAAKKKKEKKWNREEVQSLT